MTVTQIGLDDSADVLRADRLRNVSIAYQVRESTRGCQLVVEVVPAVVGRDQRVNGRVDLDGADRLGQVIDSGIPG